MEERLEEPSSGVRTGTAVAIAVVAALTVIGLIALWPRGDAPDIGPIPQDYADGTIIGITPNSTCTDIEIIDATTPCITYDVAATSGADKGSIVQFSKRPTQVGLPDLEVGDKVVLRYYPDSPVEFRYAFSDFQRSTPMFWLLVAFVAAVLAFGRLQGLRALAGLGLSLVVLAAFIVPALLRGSPALMVALVGSAAVAFLAIYLAHGINMASTIALAGTLISLAVTAVLAVIVAAATQLSGLATQDAQTLSITTEALDLRGLLIAGIVIGALGVLDDVTVSQVSTVAALRRANPSTRARELYKEANTVGRDHVASAVNTLVLAYAAAALPLLLFFAQGNQPVMRLLTSELVAVEIVRMLVGSIGLVLAVPLTTLLAATILSHTTDVPDLHGHAHGHAPRHSHRQAEPHIDAQHPDDNHLPPSRRTRPERASTTEPWF